MDKSHEDGGTRGKGQQSKMEAETPTSPPTIATGEPSDQKKKVHETVRSPSQQHPSTNATLEIKSLPGQGATLPSEHKVGMHRDSVETHRSMHREQYAESSQRESPSEVGVPGAMTIHVPSSAFHAWEPTQEDGRRLDAEAEQDSNDSSLQRILMRARVGRHQHATGSIFMPVPPAEAREEQVVAELLVGHAEIDWSASDSSESSEGGDDLEALQEAVEKAEALLEDSRKDRSDRYDNS